MGFDSSRLCQLHCHECDSYVQFSIDESLDGNHILNCPNCGHEHCRVVKNGEITSDRWDSRNHTYSVTATSSSTISTYYTSTSTSSTFMYQLWSDVAIT